MRQFWSRDWRESADRKKNDDAPSSSSFSSSSSFHDSCRHFDFKKFGKQRSASEIKKITLLMPLLWPPNASLRIRFIISFLLLIVSKLMHAANPFSLKSIIDKLESVYQQSKQADAPPLSMDMSSPIVLSVLYTLALFIAGKILSTTLNDIREVVFLPLSQYIKELCATQLFAHVHSLSYSFHLERQTAGILRALDRGTSAISFVVSFLLFNVLPTFMELGITCSVMLFSYGPEYSITLVVVYILYIFFTTRVTEWRSKLRKQTNETDHKMYDLASDSLQNFETVKLFSNESYEQSRYEAAMHSYFHISSEAQRPLTILHIGQSIIICTGQAIVLFLACRSVLNGTLRVGDIILINSFVNQSLGPLRSIGGIWRSIKTSMTDTDKMMELLGTAPSVQDIDNAEELVVTNGEIKFECVNFAYPSSLAAPIAAGAAAGAAVSTKAPKEKKKDAGGDPKDKEANKETREREPVLKSVSWTAEGGKTMAIVGFSGSGKSTTVRLLLRLFDIQSGAIKIDDQDISKITQESLRKNIGVVAQDTVLFNETIYHNIAYGKPSATEEEVKQAAKLACIDKFVETLPEKYKTKIGERGLKLSGGERQRVSLARVFLKNPKIIVFDESTSSLDSITEKEIQAAMYEVSRGRTTVIIAHRLSTIMSADQIVVMDHGQVKEVGCHAELLAMGGVYSNLWNKQLENPNTHASTPDVSNASLSPIASASS